METSNTYKGCIQEITDAQECGTCKEKPENSSANQVAECPSSFSMDPKELGRRGESAAARYLKRRGLEILDRNWTCYAGEADIIALDGDVLCFIEVKTRSQERTGFPSEAVDARKRDRYERIAACYIKVHDYIDMRVRFDVVAILVLSDHHAFLRYHPNAFGVS